MNTCEAKILIKNIGFDENLFYMVTNPVYVIKKEKIRKIYSENAVVKLNNENFENFRSREAENLEIYGDAENHYNPFADSGERENRADDHRFIDNNTNFYECDAPVLGGDDAQQNSVNMENNLEIFKNCSSSQMNQLKRMFTTMNSSNESQIIVKAYRSKLKSKFYEIYEKNSQKLQEKIKYKIFHKCNFPSCGRTFASAGWLKSHFKEHLMEIKKNKFNILFENMILNCKSLNFST
jgi:hypothetical protein